MKKTILTKRALMIRRMAVCAILTALGVVFLSIGATVEVLDLVALVLSSLCIIFAVIEIGYRNALLVWGTTCLLVLLLLPVKTLAFVYLLGGAYPILKAYFERLSPLLSWLLKLVYFNAMFALFLFLAQKVLFLGDTVYTFAPLEFALGNIAFLIYDLYLTACIRIYVFRLRRRLKIPYLQK